MAGAHRAKSSGNTGRHKAPKAGKHRAGKHRKK